MPEYRLVSTAIPDLLPMENRSPGTHVSHVIHDLCIKLGHYERTGGLPPMTRLQLGQALEHAIIDRYQQHEPDRYVKPGELHKDGLYGTPDLLDTLDYLVHEMKLTWMSAKNGDDPASEKFWKYWVQVKGYCWMLETNMAMLHVCFVNGYYTHGKDDGPEYRVWQAVFTEQELWENWKMLLSGAERLRKEGGA